MKIKTPVIGGICQSVQGRDKDRFYIIKEIYPDGSVGAVDGNYKKISSPKRKNLRHIRLLPDTAEQIAAKLAAGKQVFDTEIYSALKDYNRAADGASEQAEKTLNNEEI